MVGEEASQAAFLILQHAAVDRQKKYFPLVKNAVLEREAHPSWHPIEDEPTVDARRAAVGLPPLAEYLREFGITYVAPKRR